MAEDMPNEAIDPNDYPIYELKECRIRTDEIRGRADLLLTIQRLPAIHQSQHIRLLFDSKKLLEDFAQTIYKAVQSDE